MAFVLSRAPNGIDWQGATGTQITLGIGQADTPAVLNNIEYPTGANSAPTASGKVTLPIAKGTNILTGTINLVLPSGIGWHLMEFVGIDSQTLTSTLPGPGGIYPQDLSIDIIGV